uniref:Caspase family p20 domain-containing protein n=1 Tax=Leptobrachium leishanense TaxID=445787 RepID=A0A8C5PA47_9ANUR
MVSVALQPFKTCVFTAAGKVALLIGNNGYLNHPNLLAPMVDVYELSVLLRKIGFSVESLVDLNREDMHTAVDQFLDRLDQGVYGLFYYAGHGYERSGRNYMVPTDAPQPYRPENCISVQKILQEMQGRKTALNVVLLDTCRKWSENAEAYEVQDGDFSSGIFMTYLKKHIMKDKKVTHMLEDVLEEIGDDPLVKGKQVMEIKHTLKESRSLTDKIRPLRNTCVRRTQLEQHRRLPRQMIKFSCGVEVELRFRSVFSNLIHAFARLTFAPPHMTDIRIILYNPDTAKHSSNQVGHDHLNSLLAIGSDGEEADSMLRLHGLQKVKNDIVIKIDLHYTILSTETRAQDSLEHRIPKAWVAKSRSRNGTSLMNGDPESGATLCTSVPASHAQPNAMFTDYTAGAHSLGKESGMPISAQSKSNSEPEENDESEHIPMT